MMSLLEAGYIEVKMAYVGTVREGKGKSKIRSAGQFRKYKIYIAEESKLFAQPSITGEKFVIYQENS